MENPIQIDLGAAPGSWSQVAAEKIHKPKKKLTSVLAIDLLRNS